MIPVSSSDDAQYRKPLWSATTLDLVRATSRPAQRSLDDMHMEVMNGKDRMLFQKPHRLPRAVRRQLNQVPNRMMTHSVDTKEERDRIYAEHKAAGRRNLTKYSTAIDGVTKWVVAWPST